MTNYLFDENGIADIQDFSYEIQKQYKGDGFGKIVLYEDGTPLLIVYVEDFNKGDYTLHRRKFKTNPENFHTAFFCTFKDGKIILHNKRGIDDLYNVIEDYYFIYAHSNKLECLGIGSFGINPKAFLKDSHIKKISRDSDDVEKQTEGLYFYWGNRMIEYVVLEDVKMTQEEQEKRNYKKSLRNEIEKTKEKICFYEKVLNQHLKSPNNAQLKIAGCWPFVIPGEYVKTALTNIRIDLEKKLDSLYKKYDTLQPPTTMND